MEAYTGVILILNPTKVDTPQFKSIQGQIKYLEYATGIQVVEEVETVRDPLATQSAIYNALTQRKGRRNVIIPITGDGGLNIIVNMLMAEIEQDERPAIVPTQGGTANDCWRNLNKKKPGSQPDALFRALQLAPIQVHPIEVTVKDSATEPAKVYRGMNNAGFGHTALYSKDMTEDEYRMRLLKYVTMLGWVGGLAVDAITFRKSLHNLQTFSFYSSEGDEVHLLDRTLVHAGHAGRYGSFPRTSHESDTFLDIPNHVANRRSILLSAGRMALGIAGGQLTRQLSFETGLETVQGHVDGEPFNVPARSLVVARLADSYIELHGTRAA